MLALIPLLTSIIPSLIGVAEKAILPSSNGEKTGDLKKAFVMKMIESAYDALRVERFIHDFDGVDEKRLFLRTADVWVEELLPAVLGGK